MRFILNFFFFGILFYLIYLFFPEAFHTLVSWANNVYNFLHDLILRISEKTGMNKTAEPSSPTGTMALLLFTLKGN